MHRILPVVRGIAAAALAYAVGSFVKANVAEGTPKYLEVLMVVASIVAVLTLLGSLPFLNPGKSGSTAGR